MVKVLGETQDGRKVLVKADKLELRVGAYGIFKRGNKVALIKTYMPLWEFPGGGVNSGEALLDALKREYSEETGLVIKSPRLLFIRESFYLSPTGKVFHSFQYFFSVIGMGTKNSKLHWIPIKTLTKLNMKRSAYDALRIMLDKKRTPIFQPASIK